MARKVLGQVAGTGSLVSLYTVPTNRQATTSTLVAVNTSTAAGSLRLTVAPAGASDAAAHTVWSGTLPPGARLSLTEGWSLAATDVVRVNAASGVSASLFGSEVMAG